MQLNTSLQEAESKRSIKCTGAAPGRILCLLVLQTVIQNINRPLSTQDPNGCPGGQAGFLMLCPFLLFVVVVLSPLQKQKFGFEQVTGFHGFLELQEG